METTKGISCDATPSFARSSGVIGGKSGEKSSSADCAQDAGKWGSPWGTWTPADMSNESGYGGWKMELQITGCSFGVI